jgi:hypothetical protein
LKVWWGEEGRKRKEAFGSREEKIGAERREGEQRGEERIERD